MEDIAEVVDFVTAAKRRHWVKKNLFPTLTECIDGTVNFIMYKKYTQ